LSKDVKTINGSIGFVCEEGKGTKIKIELSINQ